MPKPTKRHAIELWRPGTALDGRGNRTGADDTKLGENIPAAITERRGSETDLAHQLAGEKQIEVSFYVDPAWNVTNKDYIVDQATGRRLEIIEARDAVGIQREVLCVCGELTD